MSSRRVVGNLLLFAWLLVVIVVVKAIWDGPDSNSEVLGQALVITLFAYPAVLVRGYLEKKRASDRD